ncbi:MAG TPA: hypothetical protein VII22_03860 [Streptosporangiaceae bacterium]
MRVGLDPMRGHGLKIAWCRAASQRPGVIGGFRFLVRDWDGKCRPGSPPAG